MSEYDEINNETEIVFTATPEFDEHFNSIPPNLPSKGIDLIETKQNAEAQSNQLPNLSASTDPDAAAQDQVDRLKAKLENHQALRGNTDHQTKQLRFRQLINETRGLNKESEKFNTQSAVLLSALTNLRSELEESEANKKSVIGELNNLSTSTKNVLHELKISKADTDETNAALQATQQQSQALVTELDELSQQTKSQRETGKGLLKQLESDVEEIHTAKEEVLNNASNVSELTAKSNLLLDEASALHQQASQRSDSLEKALDQHHAAKQDLESLSNYLQDLKQDLQHENRAQISLNKQSKSQIQQTEKLNEQQTTLIELTQSRHDQLKNELEGTLETAKKYANKLQQTDAKLKDALHLQERYKEQYAEAVDKLQSNETLLRNAAKALAETNGQNGKFNSAISKFQHTTEQSQQLVIRTQTTLESILSRNQLLERENKLLAQKLNNFNPNPSGTREPSGSASNLGLGSLGDFNFGDPQPAHQAPTDSKNGFFKVMVVLAILLPLSFIAHSMLNPTDAITAAQQVIPLSTTPSSLTFN